MLFAQSLRCCGGLVGDGLSRIAETEMNKAQKGDAPLCAGERRPLEQAPYGCWEDRAGRLRRGADGTDQTLRASSKWHPSIGELRLDQSPCLALDCGGADLLRGAVRDRHLPGW